MKPGKLELHVLENSEKKTILFFVIVTGDETWVYCLQLQRNFIRMYG